MKQVKLTVLAEPVGDYPVPELRVSLKTAGPPMSERPKIQSSRDTFDLLRPLFDPNTLVWRESFILVCLNYGMRPIAFFRVSEGGVAGTVADPKIIFQLALKVGASSIIIAHNHPSGNLTASQADIDLTRKLQAGALLLEIQLLDHVIMSEDKYMSMADEGIL